MMKYIFNIILLLLFTASPVFAEERVEDGAIEPPYFANVPHPGFSDPEGYDAVASKEAEEAASIEPAAGDESDADEQAKPDLKTNKTDDFLEADL